MSLVNKYKAMNKLLRNFYLKSIRSQTVLEAIYQLTIIC